MPQPKSEHKPVMLEHTKCILACYEEFLLLTEKMRTAVTAEDWDSLEQLEHKREYLTQQADGMLLTASALRDEQKLFIKDTIQRCIENDRTVCELIRTKQTELMNLLHNADQQRKVHQAYHSISYY
jgi:Flagellar protein FliT